MKIDFNNLKKVDKRYRPIPFWSWNDRLNVDRTEEQVRIMEEAGIGGFFMHARGGLKTEYMGKEWFDNIHAASRLARELDMYPYAYDENGWPSGFGGGLVNGLGLEYQQKSLHIEDASIGCEELDSTLLVKGGKRYFYRVNELYVDVINKKVIKEFIDKIYGEYEKRCGGQIEGFFTDEPQILRDTGYPWSFILEDEFVMRYGYSLTENLDKLFFDGEESRKVRLDYWQMVTELFSEAFYKQIYTWCTERGYKFTGHAVIEEDLFSQIVSSGACMPHYEYFTIPGMDWLGRDIFDCLTPMQLGSAAAQLGKKQVLSETFALAGHNVSHAELKRIYEWQMVRGVNLLCTHLEGYTLEGIRKRDYPPALFYQQPWWKDARLFFDTVSRVGMLLAEGEVVCDTLLLHNQTTAWALYDGVECEGSCAEKKINEYNDALLSDMKRLEMKHIPYHLGDETLIKRHGSVKEGKFIIGNMSYSTVVIPEHVAFLPFTEELLSEFSAQGGKIVKAKSLKANPVTDTDKLTYTCREFDNCTLHYFVNTDNEEVKAKISVGDTRLIVESAECVDFDGEYCFDPYESIILFDTGKAQEKTEKKDKSERVLLDGEWKLENASYNSLTLDRCDYYFDGELVEEGGYVLNILPRINALESPVELEQIYRFTLKDEVDKIYLATETPDLFEIWVNDKILEKRDEGYFRDSAFRMLCIRDYLVKGENTIRFRSTVSQSTACYEHLNKSWAFETMKNCLSYDVEIEPIYIVGDFSLELVGEVKELKRNAYRIFNAPVIAAKPSCVDVERLDLSGFSEFAGELTLSREYTFEDKRQRYVVLRGRGINSISLKINGKEVGTKMFPPYELDITDYIEVGVNRFEITLLNNLRNMMGPHHLEEGESYAVTPAHFFKESNIFSHEDGKGKDCHDTLPCWNDGICLVHFGLDNE